MNFSHVEPITKKEVVYLFARVEISQDVLDPRYPQEYLSRAYLKEFICENSFVCSALEWAEQLLIDVQFLIQEVVFKGVETISKMGQTLLSP